MKSTSILNDITLSSGTNVYIHVGSTTASINIDDNSTTFTVMIKQDELKEISNIILKTLKEMQQ